MTVFKPTDYLTSVRAMDLDALEAAGIDTLLFDLDNTLLRRNAEEVPADVREWAQSVKARGFKVCIVSNNWHARVAGVAEAIGVDIVAKAVKPLPHAFLAALSKMGSSRARSAVIGDQVFTDILGGNLLGMHTILVVPLSSSDLPHTRVLRHLERLVLAGRRPVA